MIKVIHIFPDDKFFDGVSDFFDCLSNVASEYLFCCPKGYRFKYIKQVDKLRIFNSRQEFCQYVKSSDANALYLHSLCDWDIFGHLPRGIKVIWWSWGFDIYGRPTPLSRPLVDVDLFKPITSRYLKSNADRPSGLWAQAILWLRKLKNDYRRRQIVKRVDYFTPVLPTEYELMRRNAFFRAKPFRIERGPGRGCLPPLQHHNAPGAIMVGNSYTPSNNHLDIFHALKKCSLGTRQVLIPVNYGGGYSITVAQMKELAALGSSACWVEDFMPYAQYRQLTQGATHAIFGHMRQQAVGNHALCLANGVKIYFYRDSINYKYYKERGYHVFTIEDDLTQESLDSVLTYDQALHNYNLITEKYKDSVPKYQTAFAEIFPDK